MRILSEDNAPETMQEWREEDINEINEIQKNIDYFTDKYKERLYSNQVIADQLYRIIEINRDLLNEKLTDYKANYGSKPTNA